MYKEKDLIAATNAYHRLDRCQHVVGNKAFVHTIINDLKQHQRQSEFNKRLGLLDEAGRSSEQQPSRLAHDNSKDLTRRHHNEMIYQSSSSFGRNMPT